MTLVNTYQCNAQITDLQKTYSFCFQNENIRNVINVIGDSTGIIFSYNSDILTHKPAISLTVKHKPLTAILSEVFEKNNIAYSYKSGYILLKEQLRTPSKLELAGTILDKETSQPIPYASLAVKQRAIGTIADNNGYYEITLDAKYIDDTVIFSSMGYESMSYSLKSLIQQKITSVTLGKKLIQIPPVKISNQDFETIETGNIKKKSKGSLYIDTQGQQAAVFLENERKKEGRLLNIQYYLSDEGNTDAPFRVRIYSTEKKSGKPGEDILNEVLVVKPNTSAGWYKVDLRPFDIEFPVEGLFIAMEGIFPNDYEYYSNENEFIDISSTNENTKLESMPATISYGQRLGYNRNNKHNTWHYSFSHTWFQLEKQDYGVMISAEIQFRKTKKEKRNKK